MKLLQFLEDVYGHYNRRDHLDTDPVWFVHNYADPVDREVTALVAACLAYGRIAQIMISVRVMLERLGTRPGRFVLEAGGDEINEACRGFKHRFTTGEMMADLLQHVQKVLKQHGSMRECFLIQSRRAAEAAEGQTEPTILSVLTGFVGELSGSDDGLLHLLPSPTRGSACKRLCLFLRWMVRCDEVDPGGWDGVDRAGLIVPLDVHMGRVCRALGLTDRTQANMRTALDITSSFRALCPSDPLKYDFSLTHMSMEEGPRAFEGIRNP